MPELILSDITVMGQGYCVIGLEQLASGTYRSVRPFPPRRYAWIEPFPFRRGDRVRSQLLPSPPRPPHFEDRQSMGLEPTSGSLKEDDLVRFLKAAEVCSALDELFGCTPRLSTFGGNLWARPDEAKRSICGCHYVNVRFSRIIRQPQDLTLRAQIVLPSNERMDSLPLVDREWRRFVGELVKHLDDSDALAFLNGPTREWLTHSPNSFARIGLARAKDDKCWLMLDSLFPQPEKAWFEFLKTYHGRTGSHGMS
jgi:hypothetical protein